MALSVDWVNHIITVPKTDLALIQDVPNEIRGLDLNQFRIWLGEIEASEDGITQPLIHNHNTSVLLGGIEYARIIEILDPWTVTFEDGPWAVRFSGGNTNLDEKTNVNQVSIRPNNSAGLISSPDVEFASYADGVVFNASSPYSGTMHPTGTLRQPVNNLNDAVLIAQFRGINTGLVLGGSVTVDASTPITGFRLVGEGASRTTITVLPEALAGDVTVEECHLLGTLDGNSRIIRCLLTDLNYISGYLDSCVLAQGTITLGGNQIAHILDSVAGAGLPTIDMGGSGQGLILQNYCGPLKIINKTGPESVVIGIKSGNISIDTNTVNNGTIVASGVGLLLDSNTGESLVSGTYGNLEVINLLVSNESVATAVLDEVA